MTAFSAEKARQTFQKAAKLANVSVRWIDDDDLSRVRKYVSVRRDDATRKLFDAPMIEVPYPSTPVRLAACWHELGHFVDTGVSDAPWRDESRAWAWGLCEMENAGTAVDEDVMAFAAARLDSYLEPAIRRGTTTATEVRLEMPPTLIKYSAALTTIGNGHVAVSEDEFRRGAFWGPPV